MLAASMALAGPPTDVIGPPVHLPATGQTETFPASSRDGRSLPVFDDGRVRAGAPLSYRDNGDGTVTDLNTALVWEKKCTGCEGLHDVGARFPWSADGETETVWDWLAGVNSEDGRGLAGYTDWRIANVTELLGIVDYGAVDPAVSGAFHGTLCDRRCTDTDRPSCSCTGAGEYWTSTTFSDFPAHAYAVFFGKGLVNDRVKTGSRHVRAANMRRRRLVRK